jgi:imidazoleglycerol-phosphate dehydratase
VSGARVMLDGRGSSNVSTGVPVLDHLLVLLADAGSFGLALEVEPDDPEAEVGAAGTELGRVLAPFLEDGAHGNGVMPVDEALAMVVVEVSERPRVASNVDLRPLHVGGLDVDLATQFLGGLAESARLTIHVRLLDGEDTANVLGAIFKALGVALAAACRFDERT